VEVILAAGFLQDLSVMVCGQGLIDWMILAKEEDKNEHHRALIAAACAKPLASVTPPTAPD
jgi:hypothetical protein